MKILFTLLMTGAIILADGTNSMQEEMDRMKAEFSAMKTGQEDSFKDYQNQLENEFKSYQNELKAYWKNPELSSKTKWVSYSNDKKTRSEVDFDNNTIVIEALASSKEEALNTLSKSLAYTVSADTKQVSLTDPLQKRIASLPMKRGIISEDIDNKPILATAIFNNIPTKSDVSRYVKKVFSGETMTKTRSMLKDLNLYKISVALPTNTTLKRSKVYLQSVKQRARQYQLPASLILAIMQTESNFNPFAKSHIPAFGLMQIVPKSAGVDSYKFIYNKKAMPSAPYLYNSKNNIEMGSAYLHILYYRYLKKIKNPQSRLYCAIAAYNTGAGNIAWAFTRKYNLNKAAPKINALSPQEVYDHLLGNLRFDEPKHYLKRVTKRMGAFQTAYQDI